mgnify:CR=1 FL=1
MKQSSDRYIKINFRQVWQDNFLIFFEKDDYVLDFSSLVQINQTYPAVGLRTGVEIEL